MRKYTVEFEGVTWTNGQGDIDVFSLDAAADKPIAVTGIVLKSTSELAEAQEEWLRYRAIRGHTTVGSGGASATARPLDPGDSAFSGTPRTNDTTIASAGTAVNLHSDAMNVRAGLELWLPPEDWWWTSGTSILVFRLTTAVTDDVVANGTLYLAEFC